MSEEKQENALLNIGLNVIIPSVLLMKGAKWLPETAPVWTSLVIALSFPIVYGLYDYVSRKKINAFSILGFVSVLLTGGFALSTLTPIWLAVKEAAIPGILGIACWISLKTKKPLIKLMLFNKSILKVDFVEDTLKQRDNWDKFNQLLRYCTGLLVFSFMVSAILNYVLARAIVISPAGSPERVVELGEMMMWSYPVIMAPMMVITGFALYKLVKGIKELTGLTFEQMMIDNRK